MPHFTGYSTDQIASDDAVLSERRFPAYEELDRNRIYVLGVKRRDERLGAEAVLRVSPQGELVAQAFRADRRDSDWFGFRKLITGSAEPAWYSGVVATLAAILDEAGEVTAYTKIEGEGPREWLPEMEAA